MLGIYSLLVGDIEVYAGYIVMYCAWGVVWWSFVLGCTMSHYSAKDVLEALQQHHTPIYPSKYTI